MVIATQAASVRRGVLATLFLAVALLAGAVPAQAIDIKEITTPKGVRAWFVEDDTVPIVTLRFAFKGGSAQDPADKGGLANLMSGLLDEGAGDLDSAAFQSRLDESGAELGFSESRDEISGALRTLSASQDEAFDLLALSLNRPRFDAAPFARVRNQILSGIKASEREPSRLAQDRWRAALYGEHPYARDSDGTAQTLAALTPDDLRQAHGRLFARSNLVIGVVGAINEAQLAQKLDEAFGDLPETAQLAPVADITPRLAQTLRVPFALPQASLILAYPGVPRADPRFYAANLMVEILGGSGLTSRLFDEVREKRGLAYGVDASLTNYDHLALLLLSTATNSARVDETLGVIRDTVERLAKDGPTAEELARVKTYVVGAYAINALDSSPSIASTLVELQTDGLGRDYIDRRAALINGVTLDDVKQAARDLLSVDPAVLVVGGKAE